ncbi:MAG: GUN4 domain-containing protein [Leptolyngbya sp. SIO1D8]|nr:GUN4 domain-containing protein [Leptolyngbya sp. SIO1D8]
MNNPIPSNKPVSQNLTAGNELVTQQQLSDIQQLMSQMLNEIASLRQEVSSLADLPQQVSQIEQRMMVVGDLYRYETLQEQLASQQWFAADKETVTLIADIAGVSELEDLSPRDVRSFSCGELQVIDRLWNTYSEGRFGFGVQLQIYQAVGGTLETTIGENQALIQRWGAELGWRTGVSAENPGGDRWRKCDELDFSLNAPKGCHPSRWWNSPYGSRMTNYFLNRLMTCEI